ncbi:hypothetical protein Tco_0859480 [Tanacetum coccineum]|uniref:Uncharacterized protein n=1 Tax=Tanacetum coccineum TaxID=301880 RepID=A0ABQ5BG18_9ASTR
MKDYRRETRNEEVQMELEYSIEDYKEIEEEPRPPSDGQTRSALRIGSLIIRRTNRRTVWFEGVSERVSSGVERVTKGRRREDPNGRTSNGENMGVNLPSLLVVHLERTEAGSLLQSSLVYEFVGNLPLINQGGNHPQMVCIL